MESPQITEDDRRVGPALLDLNIQGGSAKSKLPEELSADSVEPRMKPIPLDAPQWAKDIQEERYPP